MKSSYLLVVGIIMGIAFGLSATDNSAVSASVEVNAATEVLNENGTSSADEERDPANTDDSQCVTSSGTSPIVRGDESTVVENDSDNFDDVNPYEAVRPNPVVTVSNSSERQESNDEENATVNSTASSPKMDDSGHISNSEGNQTADKTDVMIDEVNTKIIKIDNRATTVKADSNTPVGSFTITRPDESTVNMLNTFYGDYECPETVNVYNKFDESGQFSGMSVTSTLPYDTTLDYYEEHFASNGYWYKIADSQWIIADPDLRYSYDVTFAAYMDAKYDPPTFTDPVINQEPINSSTEINIEDDTLNSTISVNSEYKVVIQSSKESIPVWTSVKLNESTSEIECVLSSHQALTGHTYNVHHINGQGMVDIGENQWVWASDEQGDLYDSYSIPPDGSPDPELIEVIGDFKISDIQTAPEGLFTHVFSNWEYYDKPDGNLIALAYESVNERVLQTAFNLKWLGLANGRWVKRLDVLSNTYSQLDWDYAAVAKSEQTPGEEGLTQSTFADSIDASEYSKLTNITKKLPEDANYFVTELTPVWSSIGPSGRLTGQLLSPGDEYQITSLTTDNYGDAWFEVGPNRWIYASGIPSYFDKRMVKADGSVSLTRLADNAYAKTKEWTFSTPWEFTITNGNSAQQAVDYKGFVMKPYLLTPGTVLTIVGAKSKNGIVYLHTSERY